MSSKTTFEQLCAGATGYSCDESSMVRLTKEESFNDLIFKLTTKCETNLLFLPSPTCTLSQFTLDILPNVSNASVASAWQTCEKQGFDGLNVISILDLANMTRTSSTAYTFAQFVNYIIHGIEAYFMFQKYNPGFVLNALNLWKAIDDTSMKSCAVVLVWKFDRKPIEGVPRPRYRQTTTLEQPTSAKATHQTVLVTDILSRSPLSQVNISPQGNDFGAFSARSTGNARNKTVVSEKTPDKRRRTLPANDVSTPVIAGRKRRSEVQPPVKISAEESTDEEDPEISFLNKPEQIIMPKVTYLKEMTPKKAPAEVVEPEAMEVSVPEPICMEDLTLGFEKAQPKKGGRKSTVRKSLMPDWPEEEKDQILHFFDNLNPVKTEQTRVAHTCKFAQMQYDRDLPSKLLYQWIQKKGRLVNKTNTSYEIPENEQHKATLDLFKELNPETSETSRVAFICKFVNLQYGITLTSKEFYDLLNGKGKKATKRR